MSAPGPQPGLGDGRAIWRRRPHEAARRRVDEEFSAFYRAHMRPLTLFLIHQGASAALAADVAQETMIKALQRWQELREPRAWIHTVASRDLVRAVARVEEPADPLPELAPPNLRIDAIQEWETRHHVVRVVSALPPRQRQVLAWTLSGFTPKEIAEQLGTTPEAVRASLMKARRAVAFHFDGGEEGQ
ncbi:RNA polymerase sigma factor [Streptomyces flavochromogenes]|uniref:RNA polymerase sigma factor n=1 Tax=Streptomyces flavochromogenes TaxID=68199 RepID=A0ABW6Y364_9ACTN